MAKVMVACEFSGTVREAFASLGHDAWSCDLLPTDKPGQHIQDDIRNVDLRSFDLLIGHPPCTYLAASGARWMKDPERQKLQKEAIDFVKWFFYEQPVKRFCVENPVGVISRLVTPFNQKIQPWQFGHGEVKATCLWLNKLPKLRPTKIVMGREPRIHMVDKGPERWKIRSVTYPGISAAMAAQWGRLL